MTPECCSRLSPTPQGQEPTVSRGFEKDSTSTRLNASVHVRVDATVMPG
jgi:hypothetical protein